MNLTDRQEKILNTLVKEYLDIAEPISSGLLKERCSLDISPATIRNELQELTDLGYITQPHTSAGRVPTNKGYRYFIEVTFDQSQHDFLEKEIGEAKQKIEKELKAARELTESLTQISLTLNYTEFEDKDNISEILEIVSISKTTYNENIETIRELIKKLENL